jgi:cytochrome b involved in lipid metabolism
VITSEEFEMRLSKGEELCILDDMVIIVSNFKYEHPAGRFLVEHNIGRDISKFFYGGYAMENFTGGSHTHVHSNIARL